MTVLDIQDKHILSNGINKNGAGHVQE